MKIFFALLLTVVTLAACNTISGVGDDMREAGSAISKAAR